MSAALIRFESVHRSYGATRVLEELTWSVDAGVHAVVGPNGCGKSTLLRLAAGVDAPTRGRVHVLGRGLEGDEGTTARAELAYVPDGGLAYGFLTARELLRFVDEVRSRFVPGLPPFAERLAPVARALALEPLLDRRIDALSLGGERKVYLAAALLVPARVWILDEPTNGLDADALAYLAQAVTLAGTRGCVLLASHDASFRRRLGATDWRLERAEGGTRLEATAA